MEPLDENPQSQLPGPNVSDDEFRRIVETLPLFVWTALPDGAYDYVNPQWVERTGVPAHQQLGKQWQNLVHPEDLDSLKAAWKCALENQEVFESEFRVRGADGFYRWFKSRATPQRDASGKIVKWFGTHVEIDREKWQQENLRVRFEAEAKLQKIIDTVPGVIFSLRQDVDGQLSMPYLSQLFREYYPALSEQSLSEDATPFFAAMHPDDLPQVRAAIIESRHTMRSAEAQWRTQHPTKGEIWLEAFAVPHAKTDGSVVWQGYAHEITERKKAELEAQQWTAAFRSGALGMVIGDPKENVFRAVNPAFAEQRGYSEAELIGKPFSMIFPPERVAEVRDIISHADDVGHVVFKSEHQRKDGTRLPVLLDITSIKDADGVIVSRICYAIDISQQTRAEQRSRILREAVEQSEIGVIWSNQARRVAFANAYACKLLGYTREELLGKGIWELSCNTTQEDQQRRWERLKTEGKQTFEACHRRKDGSIYCAELTTSYVNFDGQEYIFNFFQDITARKESEAALRESEAKFRAVVDQAGDLIALFDSDAQVVDVNQRVIDVLGYCREEVLKMHCWEFLSERTKDELLGHWRSLRLGETITREGYNRRRDGSHYPAEARITRVEIAGRDCFVALVRDVSERLKSEAAVRESREFLRTVLDILPQRVFWKDREGKYLGGNAAFVKDAGVADLVGKDDQEMPWRGPQADFFQMCDRRVMESGEAELDIVEPITRADGKLGWLSTSKVPLRDAKGEVQGLLGCYADITQLKEAEAALRNSEAKFRAYFENSGVAMCQLDSRTGRCLDVNPSLCAMTGYTESELLQLSFLDITHPEDYENCRHYLETLDPTADAELRCEKRYVGKNGATIWVDQVVKFFRLNDEAGFRAVAIMQDITARKLAELALRQREEEFRAFFENSSIGMTQSDLQSGKIVRVNQRLCQITGYSEAELIGNSYHYLTHPDDRAENAYGLWRLKRGNLAEFRREKRYVRKNGTTVWVDVITTLVRDGDGKPLRTMTTVQDISERKLAEQALQESETRSRLIIDTALDAVISMDATGRITGWNRRAEELLGWSAQEAMGGEMAEMIVPPSLRDAHRRGMAHYLETQEPRVIGRRVELTARRRNGELFPAELAIAAFKTEREISFTAFVQDISARKAAEEEKNRLAAIVENSEDAIISTDRDGNVTSWNHGAERLYGFRAEEMIGYPAYNVVLPESTAEESHMLESVCRGVALLQVETRRRCKDGTLIDVSVSASPIRDQNGVVIGVSRICRDITEGKRIEKELRQHRDNLRELVDAQTKDLREAKELAEAANRAKTQFLANMSHELRTPMHAILSFAKRGEDVALATSPEKLRGYFTNIATGGARLLHLLNDLLDLSKLEVGRGKFEMSECDLREAVDEVVEELAELAAARHLQIVVEQAVVSTLGWCDSTAMQQVIRNVIANAIKFSPENGGAITVTLCDCNLPSGRRATDIDTIEALSIEVADGGCGIPEHELELVFDKFVQSSKTRSKAGGTGLGLAICREIMNAHGGTIEVKNNPDAGVTFAIKVPRQARAVHANYLQQEDRPKTGREL